MNRLCTLATAFILLTTSVTANEQPTIDRKMDASKAVATVTTNRNRGEETYQLVGRNQRACGDCGRHVGCGAGSPYAGLQPTSTYQFFRPADTRRTKETIASRTETFEKAIGWVQVTNDAGVSRSRPTGWAASLTIKSDEQYDCDKCDTSKRVPFVCERNFCSKNYVVVFGTKWCSFCPKMYPVVRQLRKSGYFVLYLDAEEYPQVVKQFKLTSWPTTVVMDHGKEKARFIGVTTVEKIKKLLTKTRKEQEKPKGANYDFASAGQE